MQFARDHPDLNVIGLGAGAAPRDSLDLAYTFVERTGSGDGRLVMVYDASFRSWRQFGVTSQHYWVLYDASGNPVAARPGDVDFDIVLSVL